MPQFSNGTVLNPEHWLRYRQRILTTYSLNELELSEAIARLFLVFPLPAHPQSFSIQVREVLEDWQQPLSQLRRKPPQSTPLATIPVKAFQRKAYLDVTSHFSQWQKGTHHGYYLRYRLPARLPLLPPQLVVQFQTKTKAAKQAPNSRIIAPAASNWEQIRRGVVGRTQEEQQLAEAFFQGGETHVETALAPNQVLPLHDLATIVQAGVQHLEQEQLTLRSPDEVRKELQQALQTKKGFSLVRIGDGELLTLSQGAILSHDEIAIVGGHFLPYSGVNIPDEAARNAVLDALLQADMLGIPTSRRPLFQGLFRQVWQHYQLPLRELNLTSSLINYALDGNFYMELLKEYRVVLVGNAMQALYQRLLLEGYHQVVGAIPVHGVHDVPRALEQLQQYEYDAALVSAGVSAVLLCPPLARQGKVAIDFGHFADQLVQRQPLFPATG